MIKMPTSRLRDPAILKEQAIHICYEIEMLAFSGQHLGGAHSSPATKPWGNEKNMALESFLLHFRNLRDFLCPLLPKVNKDDICASDFLDKPAVDNEGDAAKLSKDQERINKMPAHLSDERRRFIKENNYAWFPMTMLVGTLKEMKTFLGRLPEERRRWFPTIEFSPCDITLTVEDRVYTVDLLASAQEVGTTTVFIQTIQPSRLK